MRPVNDYLIYLIYVSSWSYSRMGPTRFEGDNEYLVEWNKYSKLLYESPSLAPLHFIFVFTNKKENKERFTGFRVWFCLKLSSRRRDCSLVRRSFLRGGPPLLLSSSSSMFIVIQSSSAPIDGTWFMSKSLTAKKNDQ